MTTSHCSYWYYVCVDEHLQCRSLLWFRVPALHSADAFCIDAVKDDDATRKVLADALNLIESTKNLWQADISSVDSISEIKLCFWTMYVVSVSETSSCRSINHHSFPWGDASVADLLAFHRVGTYWLGIKICHLITMYNSPASTDTLIVFYKGPQQGLHLPASSYRVYCRPHTIPPIFVLFVYSNDTWPWRTKALDG